MINISEYDIAMEYIHKKLIAQLIDIDIDNICRKHDIKYTLHGGTLLGAIRHNGFIPWDDDADIAMERTDLIRFLDIYKVEKKPCYEIKLDGLWVYRVTEEVNVKYKGINLEVILTDIFVYDSVPKIEFYLKSKFYY